MQTWSFSRHLKILQWLPLVFRIKSKHFIMSYRALCNLILPGFPASFPPLLPQMVNLSCTKLPTWNFWNTTYCIVIQCTHTCSSCCLECPHIRLLSPMLDEDLLIPQGSALALFPLKFFTELFTWYSSKPERTTFTLPIMLYTFVHSLSLLLACGTLKSHPCTLYTSTVLWMEEYAYWIYLVISFWVHPMHKEDTAERTVMNFAGSFSLEGNFSVSFRFCILSVPYYVTSASFSSTYTLWVTHPFP